MTITDLIAGGTANPLLLAAMAFAIGALHGLEPGHSKTMMAAYVVAVRGTASQAALLGASAAVSHSIIVWVLAVVGLLYGNALIGEQMEPWFMIVSGAIIAGMGLWILRRSLPAEAPAAAHTHAPHDHAHPHGAALGHDHREGQMDAHARAHAREIAAEIGAGRTSTLQTILFGLSGGLIPCPAAITVLLLCLQVGQLLLGIGLVASFSIGLAVTLVAVGIAAAIGLRYVRNGSSRFDAILKRAPYVSAAFIGLIGLSMIYAGWSHLHGAGHA